MTSSVQVVVQVVSVSYDVIGGGGGGGVMLGLFSVLSVLLE